MPGPMKLTKFLKVNTQIITSAFKLPHPLPKGKRNNQNEKVKNAYPNFRSFTGENTQHLVIFSATKLSETSGWFCGRQRFFFIKKSSENTKAIRYPDLCHF